jgi:D-alanyl-D-alanine carboxypeptidase (penicillin-binding protein 5/6)
MKMPHVFHTLFPSFCLPQSGNETVPSFRLDKFSPEILPWLRFYHIIQGINRSTEGTCIMIRALSLLLSAVMLLPGSAVVSAASEGTAPPDADIIAPYYLVVDAGDPSIVFYERDPDERCIPASTMKIMTCILTLEHVADLEETVVVSRQAASMSETNSLMHVVSGETLTIRQLLYGLMLHSGNDAALLLANYVAGSVEAFAEMANAKAAELGMASTHFLNASGAYRGGQYSTARDMAVLTSYALKNDMFRTLISTARYTIEANDVRKKPMELVNSNRLISDDPDSDCFSSLCIGGKTGSTTVGGQCLIAIGRLDGAEVIVVLIGADDYTHRDANKRMPRVFQNGKLFIEYTLENDYVLLSPEALGYAYEKDVTVNGLAAPISVFARFEEGAGVRLPKSQAAPVLSDVSLLETQTQVTADLSAVQAGDVIGTITCSYNGLALFSGELVASVNAVVASSATPDLPENSQEPEAAPIPAEPSSAYGAGFLIFAGISLALLISLVVLIAQYARRPPRRRRR